MIKLLMVIGLHLFVVIGNFIAFFVVPFVEPWYVALPICSVVFFLTFGRFECPLTRLENKIRRKLDMEEIRGFVKHYIVKPIREKLGE